MTSEVTVIGESQVVQLQRSDASLGQLINAQQVAELPLNGRNFVQLALLGPGTVTGRAGSFLAQGPSSEVSYRGSMSVSAQGMRENANDWLYDGVDDNELTRRRRRHPAEHRLDPRVQGPHPQLPVAVRQPRWHDGAGEQQVR